MPEKNFCASPWVELVLGLSGNCTPCCRNSTCLGEWRKDSLGEIWHSDVAVGMRQKISQGAFPDRMCEACYGNNTQASLRKLLQKSLFEIRNGLSRVGHADLAFIDELEVLFDKKEHDEESLAALKAFNLGLEEALRGASSGDGLHAVHLSKLEVMRDVVDAFLSSELKPERIAPLREPNLIAICNARCIHCSGAILGNVRTGRPMPDGSYIQQMSAEDVEKALSHESDLLDFFMNGTEVLFSKYWRDIADRLSRQGIRLRVSTNGMLLTPETSEYLVQKGVIGKLNVSLDGASREVVEKVRCRVKFDQVVDNLHYFYGQLERHNYPISVSLSFVLCKDNYRELADFVRLAANFGSSNVGSAGKLGVVRKAFRKLLPRKKKNFTRPHILIQGMSPYGPAVYGEHFAENSHNSIDQQELKKAFAEMQQVAEALRVRVIVFYRYELDDFIKAGYPFPDCNFVTA